MARPKYTSHQSQDWLLGQHTSTNTYVMESYTALQYQISMMCIPGAHCLIPSSKEAFNHWLNSDEKYWRSMSDHFIFQSIGLYDRISSKGRSSVMMTWANLQPIGNFCVLKIKHPHTELECCIMHEVWGWIEIKRLQEINGKKWSLCIKSIFFPLKMTQMVLKWYQWIFITGISNLNILILIVTCTAFD